MDFVCLPSLLLRAIFTAVFIAFCYFFFRLWIYRGVRTASLWIIRKFLIVKLTDHHLRNAMVGQLHLQLGNYSMCCLTVNVSYFKEIGQVVHHTQECLLPKDKLISSNFLPRARRKFIWLKLFAGVCWAVCLADCTP